MKLRIIASTVLIMILSATFSNNASARGWRGGGHRGGYYPTHRVVRVCQPPVAMGGYYARAHVRPVYYAHACHRRVYRHHGCYR